VGIAVIAAAIVFDFPTLLSIALIVFAVGWLAFAIRDRRQPTRRTSDFAG
jgi:hypothetical protein